MKTSEAQKRAVARYDAANTLRISIKLNRNTDADLVKALEETDNKQQLIKDAVRAYIDK